MAATAPVVPSDIEPLLTQESDSVCTGLINLAKLSWLAYKWVRWKYKADGTGFTEDYKSFACGIECPAEVVDLSEEEEA